MTDANYDLSGKRVWVAGHRGMVGAALVKRLDREPVDVLTAPRGQLDLRRQTEVEAWMEANRPEIVFVAAAKVGGIGANAAAPATFLYDNLMIEANVVEAAYRYGVDKFVMLGSTCIYPRLAEQPIAEEALLTGPLEPTNEAYAIAKIAGIKLCEAYRRQYGCDFIAAQPTNLYGPGDNFDLEKSHVLAALLRKAHEAKRDDASTLSVWGTGTPLREFLHVDDCADALVHLAKHYSGAMPINLGTGEEVSIRELAERIAQAVGFDGELEFDTTRPDGTPRKLADTSRLRALGWQHAIDLNAGLAQTYDWYKANVDKVARAQPVPASP